MVEQEPQRSIKGVQIEGVPLLKQKKLWCGITSLAMLIQHRGFQDVSPEKVFETINGEGSYNSVREQYDPKLSPTMGHLADLVEGLTDGNLTASLITQRTHQALAQKNPEKFATPADVMQYFLLAQTPCMVRTPGHFSVVTGFDFAGGLDRKGVYFVNDPLFTDPRKEDMSDFEKRWGAGEVVPYNVRSWEHEAVMTKRYPEDPHFQMLIVRPTQKS